MLEGASAAKRKAQQGFGVAGTQPNHFTVKEAAGPPRASRAPPSGGAGGQGARRGPREAAGGERGRRPAVRLVSRAPRRPAGTNAKPDVQRGRGLGQAGREPETPQRERCAPPGPRLSELDARRPEEPPGRERGRPPQDRGGARLAFAARAAELCPALPRPLGPMWGPCVRISSVLFSLLTGCDWSLRSRTRTSLSRNFDGEHLPRGGACVCAASLQPETPLAEPEPEGFVHVKSRVSCGHCILISVIVCFLPRAPSNNRTAVRPEEIMN